MITLCVLLLIVLAVLGFMGAVATGFLLVFGDLIIAILIIVGIVKLVKHVKRCKKKK